MTPEITPDKWASKGRHSIDTVLRMEGMMIESRACEIIFIAWLDYNMFGILTAQKLLYEHIRSFW